jgi:soluble lytic murein transglycosylase-like protein/outer membrane protein assembly factor BamD (BamD/ComL family)
MPWWADAQARPARRGLLLALGLAAAAPAGAGAPGTVGTVLPAAPGQAPGRVAPPADDALQLARERYLEGDAVGAIAALRPWLEGRRGSGRARAAGHLLLGRAHEDLGQLSLASTHYGLARKSGSPVAELATLDEARVDLARGRAASALATCRGYLDRFPDGAHRDACLLLSGKALAASGNRGAAAKIYEEYLKTHPDSPREEELRLAVALAAARSRSPGAVGMLHELALDHSWPSTDLAVQAALDDLRAAGFDTALPADPATRLRRAEAVRRSGLHEQSWAQFQALRAELRALPSPTPAEQALLQDIEQRADRFAWNSRQYAPYAESLSAQYTEAPSADVAWDIFRAWSRGGRYDLAIQWAEKGETAHAGAGPWRSAADDLAWAELHAGRYAEAAVRWDKLARGGGMGRKARFYSAFAALRAGDTETALTRFDALLQSPGDEWRAPGLYWRAKARRAKGDAAGAQADLDAAIAADDTGWYRLMAAGSAQGAAAPGLREGLWSGDPAPELPARARPAASAAPSPGLSPATRPLRPDGPGPGLRAPAMNPGWSSLSWERLQAPPPRDPALTRAPDGLDPLPAGAPALPEGYVACSEWDPGAAQAAFARFSEQHKTTWPGLPTAHDLAMAGLAADSARAMGPIFAEWREAVSGELKGPRADQIKALRLSLSDWRPFLLLTRDHYHAARACHGLARGVADPAEQNALLRLNYPVVEPQIIWSESQRYGVDPYLILGIMRQESTYRNTALSPVGAIGLIQVMPRTGARIAAMLGEHEYSPGDLEDPSTNLRYGIYYFSRLLERFEGSFPLAVGAYNGGPHNIGRWYAAHQGRIEMDAFVEQIEYDETRDYVRKVTGNYARYVAIYEGDAARVRVPAPPAADHPEVINF